MELAGRTVALYGRFSAGVRERLAGAVTQAGGEVARDLMLSGDVLVVGGLATALIDSGALPARLAAARGRGVPVYGERAFAAALAGEAPEVAATLPLATALGQSGLSREDADMLAAFDLVMLEGEACRFGDASVLRTMAELLAAGRSRAEAVRILSRARDLAPRGRHRIVLTPGGEAALQWEDGVTTLDGQGVLQLAEDHESLDDLFQAAALALAVGETEEAARLYDSCARADRKDPIALYNIGNIRLGEGALSDAIFAYRRALGRDPRFVEARYNLAQALEAAGQPGAAALELVRVLNAAPKHADAIFNLAQLRMAAGAMAEAKGLYERYLTLDPPADWAATARTAIAYCAAQLRA
jgi:tetratricopeptide (TPR) repeat protein